MSETYELTYDENHRSPMRRNHRSPMIHDLRIHVVRHTNKRTQKSFITIINRANYAALIGSLNTQKTTFHRILAAQLYMYRCE